MQFYARAIWDAEAGIFYSESDIIGLHIEAATLQEFEAAVAEFGPQLVLENHLTKNDLTRKSLVDLIPSIFVRPPSGTGATAA